MRSHNPGVAALWYYRDCSLLGEQSLFVLQHNLLYAGSFPAGRLLNKGAAFFVSDQLCYRLTRLLRINYLLISQPFITVEQMDDATVVESRLC